MDDNDRAVLERCRERDRQRARERYANLSEDDRERARCRRRERYANLSINDRRRERYTSLQEEDRERILQRAADRYANLLDEERDRIRQRATERYGNLPEEERDRIRQRNMARYTNLDEDNRVRIRERELERYANLSEEDRNSMLQRKTESYVGLPERDRFRMRKMARERSGRSHSRTIVHRDPTFARGDENASSSQAHMQEENNVSEITLSASVHWQAQAQQMNLARRRSYVMCTWNKRCTYCQIPLLNVEQDGFCCNNGRWQLPSLPPLPAALNNLYNNPGFQTDARKINRLFCFSVLGVDGGFVNLDFPSSVTITGRTYHRVLPTTDIGNPIHWYIYDESQRYAHARNQAVPFQWIATIGSILSQINPFIHHLRTMGSMHMPSAYITIEGAVASDEIAAIAEVNNTIDIRSRVAGFWVQSQGEPTFINILDPMYEPLQYPLFYPHGILGWGPANEYNLTQLQWYRARLLHEERFQQLGRLCGEYLVDMYSRVEDARLNYFRTPVFQSRRIQYDEDYSERENDDQNDIVLPASFLGSKRWCSVQVADALALSRAKGRPTLFITMTTNVDWPEIRIALKPRQNASDAPMVVVRCFHDRLQRLKELLRNFFQQISYMMHVVEFQKRGLPHSHLVLRTEPEIPIDCIDDIISAELPSDPILRAQVQKFMTHKHTERCSPNNSPCCYGFPKPVNPTTYVDSRGYVQYRRRTVDDMWIVPYNAFLLRELDCHITVDIASTVHVFSYLYGYIYKGFDTANFRVTEETQHVSKPLSTSNREPQHASQASSTNLDQRSNVTRETSENGSVGQTVKPVRNEIRDYVNARYLSATEASWRIMSYHITDKTPSVKCLPLHLPLQSTNSLLDRYFLRPVNSEFDTLTYIQYYEQSKATAINFL